MIFVGEKHPLNPAIERLEAVPPWPAGRSFAYIIPRFIMNLHQKLLALPALLTLFVTTASTAFEVDLPHYTGVVQPAVQENLSDPKFYVLGERWEVRLPDEPQGALRFAEKLLAQRLAEQSSLAGGQDSSAADRSLRITLGHLKDADAIAAASGFDLNIADTGLPAQGYLLRVREDGGELHVFVLGADTRGIFYGASTLIQQIGVEDGRLGVRTNDLNDWPAWEQRYFGDYLPYGPDAMAWCAINKISGYAIQTRNEWRYFAPDVKPRFTNKFSTWKDALDAMNEFREATGLVDYMIILHIYAAGPREYPMINIAKESDIQDFIERCRYAAENGFSHIMIAADDMTRHDGNGYVCVYDEEREKFGDSIGRAHGYLVKRVYDALVKDYPEMEFSFVPAPYSLYDHRVPQIKTNQKYLFDMSRELPDAVRVVWTGPKVLSDHITIEDSDAFREYVNGLSLLLWDNTNETGHPPMPVWRTRFEDDYTQEARFIYANTHLFGWPWDMAYASAANSYLWNPNRYDADAAHREATVKLHGPGSDELAAAFIEHKHELDHNDESVEIKLGYVSKLESVVEQMASRGMPTKYLRGYIDSRKGRLSTEIPRIPVARFEQPIKLDGHLNDKAWQDAAAFDLGPVNRDRREKYPANGMIGYDDENLYLAFTVRHSTTLKAPRIADRRDEAIYKESDAIEIFLQPEGREDYGHLVFDFVGHIYDKHHGDEASVGLAWNPDWEVAIHRLEEGQWIAEAKIPFESLGPLADNPPTAGTTWRGNFCRFSIHDSQTSNWSATFGKFHQTSRFGYLDFQ